MSDGKIGKDKNIVKQNFLKKNLIKELKIEHYLFVFLIFTSPGLNLIIYISACLFSFFLFLSIIFYIVFTIFFISFFLFLSGSRSYYTYQSEFVDHDILLILYVNGNCVLEIRSNLYDFTMSQQHI